ncbi:hypothetical protein [Enterococcus sp. AZ196]|uniref:hypothetical protein n=1 Tax=Enterococcus sp. AZ196 TaxID=2774659 RepID=UPI003D2B774D
MNVTRFRNLCGALNLVLKFMALIAVVSVFAGIGNYLNNSFTVSRDFSPGFTLINTSSGSLEDFTNSQIALAEVVTKSLSLLVVAFLLVVGSNILLDIWLEKSPFSEKQTQRLTVISLGIIILSLVQSPLFSAVLSAASPSARFISFDIGWLFIFGMVMLCMTGIFKYGAALQKLSDDTV